MMTSESQPDGLCLAVLGSDGAGKSTLLARLQELLRPIFPEQEVIHFRPKVWEKKTSGVVTDPHGRPPRNILLSWLKVAYYFADHWVGWWKIVRPAKKRGALVIFDRSFDDLLVDEKRYRLRGTALLVKLLRRCLPRNDAIFVLAAPANILHARKPELSLDELERQQTVLERLAKSSERYVLVSAAEAPEKVAQMVRQEVLICMAAQKERKN
jgi:thymidylate kinase